MGKPPGNILILPIPVPLEPPILQTALLALLAGACCSASTEKFPFTCPWEFLHLSAGSLFPEAQASFILTNSSLAGQIFENLQAKIMSLFSPYNWLMVSLSIEFWV